MNSDQSNGRISASWGASGRRYRPLAKANSNWRVAKIALTLCVSVCQIRARVKSVMCLLLEPYWPFSLAFNLLIPRRSHPESRHSSVGSERLICNSSTAFCALFRRFAQSSLARQKGGFLMPFVCIGLRCFPSKVAPTVESDRGTPRDFACSAQAD